MEKVKKGKMRTGKPLFLFMLNYLMIIAFIFSMILLRRVRSRCGASSIPNCNCRRYRHQTNTCVRLFGISQHLFFFGGEKAHFAQFGDTLEPVLSEATG